LGFILKNVLLPSSRTALYSDNTKNAIDGGDDTAQIFPLFTSTAGYTMAHLVEALRYKPEGRGFDSQWCYWNFSLP
jgi:hypothetical protein